LDVYKVEKITKEKFVINVVQVEIQHRHFCTIHHVAKAINATTTYRTKDGIGDINMV
jgi:hypothetical protein